MFFNKTMNDQSTCDLDIYLVSGIQSFAEMLFKNFGTVDCAISNRISHYVWLVKAPSGLKIYVSMSVRRVLIAFLRVSYSHGVRYKI